jgi:hypothetical protein
VLSQDGPMETLQMRFVTKVMAALVLVAASGGIALGATNCGFLTIEQCRATITGGSSFCVPNQFYNPQRPAKGVNKRQEVRAYALPYDPYPWCAFYSDPGN